MALYSIYADKKKYRYLGVDRNQSREVFGEDVKNQFDINFEAKPYADNWQTLNVNFTDDGAGLSGDLIPEISEHNGRLFLSPKAYEVLKNIIKKDGEFLPGFFFSWIVF
jgi:ribulose 1,5-bisphosphate carboxylase large subunit-like protein